MLARVRAGAVCAPVPWFAVLPPPFRCSCAPLSFSAACCCVVCAVVLWLVAVFRARRASLVPVVLLFLRSVPSPYPFLFSSGSFVLPASTLSATLCIWRAPKSTRFLPFPLSHGQALLPCAHFALARPSVALFIRCLRSFLGHIYPVCNQQSVRVDRESGWFCLFTRTSTLRCRVLAFSHTLCGLCLRAGGHRAHLPLVPLELGFVVCMFCGGGVLSGACASLLPCSVPRCWWPSEMVCVCLAVLRFPHSSPPQQRRWGPTKGACRQGGWALRLFTVMSTFMSPVFAFCHTLC